MGSQGRDIRRRGGPAGKYRSGHIQVMRLEGVEDPHPGIGTVLGDKNDLNQTLFWGIKG